MRRVSTAFLTAVVLATSGSGVRGQTSATANAADSYVEAAKLMDALYQSKPELEQFSRYEEGAIDAQAGAFFARNSRIAEFVRKAASAAACDWKEQPKGFRYPSLNGIRGIGNFVNAQTSYAIQQHDMSLAIKNLLATMALARRANSDHALVSALIELAMEMRAIDRLAEILPGLPPETQKALPTLLESLPKPTSGAELMAGELSFAKNEIREQQDGLFTIAMADSLEPFYTELGVAMDVPQTPEQFTATVDADLASKMKLNTFAQVSGPSFKQVYPFIATLRAKRAMLLAAVDIAANGDAGIAKAKDPFGAGPFVYSKHIGGFELTSALKTKGNAVRLIIGPK